MLRGGVWVSTFMAMHCVAQPAPLVHFIRYSWAVHSAAMLDGSLACSLVHNTLRVDTRVGVFVGLAVSQQLAAPNTSHGLDRLCM